MDYMLHADKNSSSRITGPWWNGTHVKSLVSHHSAHQDTVVGPMNFYLQRGGPSGFWWREQPKKGRWVMGRHHAKLHWNYMPFFPDCAFWRFWLWCLWETQGILGHVHSDQSTQLRPMNDSESFKLGNPARRWTGFSVHGFMAKVNWPDSYCTSLLCVEGLQNLPIGTYDLQGFVPRIQLHR